jgi:plasmid replication initiation protein
MVTETPKIENSKAHLLPDRHPQHDLFICDVADAVLKEMTSVMEHPFYSLSKKPETVIRRYEHNAAYVEIIPSVKGLATIYDKDILIYCTSQIISKLNRGEKVSQRVRINSRDLLIFTNRGTAGKDYEALSEALLRLGGTRIRTNIKTGDEEQTDMFGLIDASTIRRKEGLDGRLLWCEITISEWVFNAIRANEVLTLHRDYFRLRKPLERRVYELARKHCGLKERWAIGVELLWKKSGSKSPLKQFRYMLKKLAENDHLPDYLVSFVEERDQVVFVNRNTMPGTAKQAALPLVPLESDAFEAAREAAPGWDVYYLEQEWRQWMSDGGMDAPKSPGKAFVGFCRKWFERRGKP